MIDQGIINWLLDGDVAIQYQVHRDLLHNDRTDLRQRIAKEGWGARFLEAQHKDGYWGTGYYQPKWTSTHYTLLDLKNLFIMPEQPAIQRALRLVLNTQKASDGGILPIGIEGKSDVCVNGMFLNYASYFQIDEEDVKSVVDCLLKEHMGDGGFNCFSNRKGAKHSSLHSTISVLEGIFEFQKNGYSYRLNELIQASSEAVEFILKHHLFRSHTTGDIISKAFLMLSYPSRWKYDILRALDFIQMAKIPYDKRIDDALQVLKQKQRKNNTWPVQAKHPGKTHFDMEITGCSSRWNTLRALRVLNYLSKTQ